MSDREAITKYMAFYPSFREVIDKLPTDEKRLAAYDMFTDYGLYGIEPDKNIDLDLMLIFIMAKPNIKKFNKDLSNGCKGGRPKKKDDEKKEEETPVKTPKKTPVKTKKEKEIEEEKEMEKESLFTSTISCKEGEMLSPSADAGEASPFTFTDIEKCIKENNIKLSQENARKFFLWMEKYNWKINGNTVNLKNALVGYAKKHEEIEKNKPTTSSSIMNKAKKYMSKKMIQDYLANGINWVEHIPEHCPKDIFTDDELVFFKEKYNISLENW